MVKFIYLFILFTIITFTGLSANDKPNQAQQSKTNNPIKGYHRNPHTKFNNISGNYLSLNFISPTFARDNEMSILSGVWIFTGNIKVGKNLELLFDLPISNFSELDRNYLNINNPFVGIRVDNTSRDYITAGQFGIYLPLAGREGYQETGIVSVYTDYLTAPRYFYDQLCFRGDFMYQKLSEQNFFIDLSIGLFGLLDKDNAENFDLLNKNYFGLGFNDGSKEFVIGARTMWLITSDDDFDENFASFLSIKSAIRFDHFKPGIELIIPYYDQVKRRIDFTLNFGVQLFLK